MFSEHKRKQEEAQRLAKNGGELIFDDLEAKTSNLKLLEDAKKEPKYMSEMEVKNPKRRSIKKSEQKPSTMSLNVKNISGDKAKDAGSTQRSNSLETPGLGGVFGQNVGLGIFEAATMMCNIVDITTDSTTKTLKNDKAKTLKSKESKTSLGSGSGPFSQMKEAQEMKKKSKNSFDDDDNDD